MSLMSKIAFAIAFGSTFFLFSCKSTKVIKSPYIVGMPPEDETVYH